jgi:hypothetical protein
MGAPLSWGTTPVLQACRSPFGWELLSKRRSEDGSASTRLPQPGSQGQAPDEPSGGGPEAAPEPQGRGQLFLLLPVHAT